MKSTKQTKTYFFEDKPLFGLDIGYRELRVMQVEPDSKVPQLKAYGSAPFDASAVKDGVIIKPEIVAKAAKTMFESALVGDITTKRVAASLPAARAFTRSVQLPKMNAKEIDEAVQTEAAQYMTTNIDKLYLDYSTIREEADTIEVFVVAMPKSIVDSYLVLGRMLGLEMVLLDTSIGANARLFAKRDNGSKTPSVLIDFGTKSTDITVFNKGLVVTGTVAFGGDDITATIAKTLRVTPHEAVTLKSNYGLAASVVQKQVIEALSTSLEQLIKEIRRSIRYYEQRYPNEPPISQIVTMGGGASMPGLAAYLTDQMRLAVRSFDPVTKIDFGHLEPMHAPNHMSFSTVTGLALTNPGEIFA